MYPRLMNFSSRLEPKTVEKSSSFCGKVFFFQYRLPDNKNCCTEMSLVEHSLKKLSSLLYFTPIMIQEVIKTQFTNTKTSQKENGLSVNPN